MKLLPWPCLYFFCLLFFLITPCFTKAQMYEDSDRKGWEIGFNLGVHRESVSDKSFSSLFYNGYNLGGSLSIKYNKEKVSQQMMFYYTQGKLQVESNTNNNLDNTYFNFDFIRIYNLKTSINGATIFRAGCSINVLYDYRNYHRYINHTSSFEFAASLSGAIEVSHSFKNKFAGLSISNQLTLPLISGIEQPVYGSDYADGSANGNNINGRSFLKYIHVAFFPDFFRVKNMTSLEKIISPRQKISLDYVLDYYKFTEREVRQVNHRLGITYKHSL